MARKYRRRRKRKRKMTRKRKSYIPQLLGKSFLTRMKLVQGFSLNPGAGAITSFVVSANGITVPSGGANQPTGFDQMNAFFDQYKVLGSKIKMSYVANTISNGIPGVFGIFNDNDSTLSYSNFPEILMSNQTGKKTTTPKIAGLVTGTFGVGSAHSSYSAKKTYRLGGSQELDLYGTAATNPIEEQFYQCYYGSPDTVVDSALAHFIIQVDYVVLWTNRKLTAVSVAPV